MYNSMQLYNKYKLLICDWFYSAELELIEILVFLDRITKRGARLPDSRENTRGTPRQRLAPPGGIHTRHGKSDGQPRRTSGEDSSPAETRTWSTGATVLSQRLERWSYFVSVQIPLFFTVIYQPLDTRVLYISLMWVALTIWLQGVDMHGSIINTKNSKLSMPRWQKNLTLI